MTRQVIAGSVFVVFLLSSAAAQVPDQIFQRLFNTLQQLQQNQRIPPQFPPTQSGSAGPLNISSSKPTIDCSNIKTPLGLILCGDENAAKADWDVNAAAWAYAFTLEEGARKAFWDRHDAWVQSLFATCKLTPATSDSQRRCVVNTYHVRAEALQSKLTGDALIETKLSPEQRAAIQARLISLGLLSGEPDGEFGPSTRAAIGQFQQANGFQESAYLTTQQLQLLLTSRIAQTQAPEPNAGQPDQSRTRGFPTAPSDQANTSSRGHPEATQFPTVPTSQTNTSLPGRSEATQSARTETVQITASGDTPDAARKEAARMAVQQVAGVFIDHRRIIEINMSDKKVSEIVNEKILSYTNAYVSKLEVLSTDEMSGIHTITAEVTVALGPLLKTLQENKVPTFPFDSSSAAATAETISDEKEKALRMYRDLIARLDTLVQIGIGKAEVSPSIPSAAGSTWISVPITFFANKDAAEEWRKKFELIADRHARIEIAVPNYPTRGRECALPRATAMPMTTQETFLHPAPGSGQTETGVAACFISSASPKGLIADCRGRAFVLQTTAQRPGGTDTDISIAKRASLIRLVVNFIDKNGSAVYSFKTPFRNFPSIDIQNSSRSAPERGQPVFFNYCGGNNQSAFFFLVHSARDFSDGSGITFGDTIIFPPPGTRINGFLNVLLPNDKISQIDKIQASIRGGP